MRKVSRRAIAKFGHQAPHLLSVMCLNVALHAIDLTRPSGIHNDYNLIGSPLSAGGGTSLTGMSNRSLSPRDFIHSGSFFERAEAEGLITLGRSL